jgi:hypothetical protein
VPLNRLKTDSEAVSGHMHAAVIIPNYTTQKLVDGIKLWRTVSKDMRKCLNNSNIWHGNMLYAIVADYMTLLHNANMKKIIPNFLILLHLLKSLFATVHKKKRIRTFI